MRNKLKRQKEGEMHLTRTTRNRLKKRKEVEDRWIDYWRRRLRSQKEAKIDAQAKDSRETGSKNSNRQRY